MKLFIILAVIGYVAAQTTVQPLIRRIVVNDGRYRGYDDGKYRPDGLGKYSGDNGRYIHDGRPYIHLEPDYVEQPQPQIVYIQSTPAPTRALTTLPPPPPPTTTTTTTPKPTTTTTTTTTTPKPTTTTQKPVPSTKAPLTVIKIVQQPAAPQVEYVGSSWYPYGPYARQYNYGTEGGWRIFRFLKESNQEGYNYAYETENKILGQESGRLFNYGTGLDGDYRYGGIRANGFYEYVGDDGNVYRVDYLADENGFQPVGAHIPKEVVEVLSTL